MLNLEYWVYWLRKKWLPQCNIARFQIRTQFSSFFAHIYGEVPQKSLCCGAVGRSGYWKDLVLLVQEMKWDRQERKGYKDASKDRLFFPLILLQLLLSSWNIMQSHYHRWVLLIKSLHSGWRYTWTLGLENVVSEQHTGKPTRRSDQHLWKNWEMVRFREF